MTNLPPLLPDPVIDEIREIRNRLSAECNHAPKSLVASVRRFEQQYRDRCSARARTQE
jgi:hypothetical protein